MHKVWDILGVVWFYFSKMLHIERFINELMASNCYIVADEALQRCVCIDPASEKSVKEIEYIEKSGFTLDYILLTHEHTDHTWGVNALLDNYPLAKVICSELCKEALPREAKAYFQFYYDDPNYVYNVKCIDFTTEELNWQLEWLNHMFIFIPTPGHSPGSVCIAIDNILFGGDTLMPFKPFIKKRNGGSLEQFKDSVYKIMNTFPKFTQVYPGHGELFILGEWEIR